MNITSDLSTCFPVCSLWCKYMPLFVLCVCFDVCKVYQLDCCMSCLILFVGPCVTVLQVAQMLHDIPLLLRD